MSILSRMLVGLAERDPGLAFQLIEAQIQASIDAAGRLEFFEHDINGRGYDEYAPALTLRTGGTERVPLTTLVVHEDFYEDAFVMADYADGSRIVAAPSFNFGIVRTTDAVGTRFEIVHIESLPYRR